MSSVLRGGSWFNIPVLQRVSYRFYSYPDVRSYGIGFRLVIGGVL